MFIQELVKFYFEILVHFPLIRSYLFVPINVLPSVSINKFYILFKMLLAIVFLNKIFIIVIIIQNIVYDFYFQSSL